MKHESQWREALVELGLVALVCGLLASAAALIGGGLRGRRHRGQGDAVQPPAPGEIPGHRHHNTGTVSTR